jgi:predicted acyltransferase
VLVAGGWSAVLLGVFYWIVDVRGWQRWTTPFVWVGANPITLYVCSGLGFFRTISERLVGHPGKEWAWVSASVTFALMLTVARWLWRRGIFIKV